MITRFTLALKKVVGEDPNLDEDISTNGSFTARLTFRRPGDRMSTNQFQNNSRLQAGDSFSLG